MLFFLLINVIWAGRGCYGQRGREGERRKEERRKDWKERETFTNLFDARVSELSLCSSIVKIYKMKIKYETHLKDNCQLSWQCVCLYMELALCEIYLGYRALLVFNLECPKSASTFFWEWSSSHLNYRLSLVN